MTRWFEETIHAGLRLKLEIDELLHEEQTDFQHLMLFENSVFGRVLALDRVTQTTERDEFTYHEMLVHQPIFAHGDVRNVLIIGGGDGGVLEEVFKHRTIERAVLVDLDRRVIELSQKYLRSICGDAHSDPRAEIKVADGIKHVAETDDRYDVIIIDSTDPIGPSQALFEVPFYADCQRCLAPGGVMVTQNGVPFLQPEELVESAEAWRSLFADWSCYLTTVPTYIGGQMALGWASDAPALRVTPLETITERFAKSGIETRYYTPAVHQAAFALPRYIDEIAAS
jgi:spermidine synthase